MLSGLGNFVVDCHISRVRAVVQCSQQRNKVTLG